MKTSQQKAPHKRLAVIIVSFNTKELLQKCLDSVRQQMQDDWEVWVVDNASSDGSSEYLKSLKWIHFIQNINNEGFAKANNAALKQTSAKYCMLLNSDAELLPNQPITALLSELDNNPKIGIITPRIILPTGKLDQACHRGMPSPWNGLCYFSGLEKVTGKIPLLNKLTGGYHLTWKDLSVQHSIDACSGAGMIVRSSSIAEVGLMDEQFFFYAEDVDWCMRFLRAGYEIVFDPSVTILHKKSQAGKNAVSPEQSDSKKRAQAAFFSTMKQFYAKWYADTYPAWFMKFVYFGISCVEWLKTKT